MRLADVPTMDEGQLITNIALYGGEYTLEMTVPELQDQLTSLIMAARQKGHWSSYVWKGRDGLWVGYSEHSASKEQIHTEGHKDANAATVALRMARKPPVKGTAMVVQTLDHEPTDLEVIDMPAIPTDAKMLDESRRMAEAYFEQRRKAQGNRPKARQSDIPTAEGQEAAKTRQARKNQDFAANYAGPNDEIKALLEEKKTADTKRSKQIRQRLRALGYRLSEQR